MFRFFHRYEDVSVESTVRKQLHLMQAITYFIIIRVDVFCYGELLILDKVALVKQIIRQFPFSRVVNTALLSY